MAAGDITLKSLSLRIDGELVKEVDRLRGTISRNAWIEVAIRQRVAGKIDTGPDPYDSTGDALRIPLLGRSDTPLPPIRQRASTHHPAHHPTCKCAVCQPPRHL